MCPEVFFMVCVFIALLLIVLCVFINDKNKVNSNTSSIAQWATNSGYKLIDQKRASAFEGPVVWTERIGTARTIKRIVVYRISVEDQGGNIRQGWLRLSFWLLNTSSVNIEVLWDNENPPLYTDKTPVGWINLIAKIIVMVIFVLFLIYMHPSKLTILIVGWLLYGVVVLVKKFTT